jgi:hypothetical protein
MPLGGARIEFLPALLIAMIVVGGIAVGAGAALAAVGGPRRDAAE